LSDLSARDLLALHALVARYLGVSPGVADPAALRLALVAPDQVAAGDLFERAAALAQAIVQARPFRAANVAQAAAAAALYLRAYDLELQLTTGESDALRDFLRGADRLALAAWLRAHTEPLPLAPAAGGSG